jgi:hypothetical protein
MICKFTGLVIEEFRLFWPKDEAYVSDVEPSGPFLVLTDAGKVRYARGADHLNLQKWCPTICFWSGFSEFPMVLSSVSR